MKHFAATLAALALFAGPGALTMQQRRVFTVRPAPGSPLSHASVEIFMAAAR